MSSPELKTWINVHVYKNLTWSVLGGGGVRSARPHGSTSDIVHKMNKNKVAQFDFRKI